MTIQLLDGLKRSEAETCVRTILREEKKLREMGGGGNYTNVRYVESYRRGHTLDSRDDIVRYKVLADKVNVNL